jgi:hypothetical protein
VPAVSKRLRRLAILALAGKQIRCKNLQFGDSLLTYRDAGTAKMQLVRRGQNGNPNRLFFIAGPNGHANGLFGVINSSKRCYTPHEIRALGNHTTNLGPESICTY